VNIDITPRVFNNREIGMKLALDVSSVTGSSTIGGVTQPIISQRKIEHDIRLKEGEVNILGGIFENQDTKSVEGLPGLSKLPFLKYLFSENKTQRVENEIVFVLIPRIVRGQDLNELNERAIDVGTANSLNLRHLTQRPNTLAAPATQTPVQIQQAPPQAPQQQAPAAPGTQPPAASTPQQSQAPAQQQAAPNGNAGLQFNPASVDQTIGTPFNVQLMVSNVQDLYSAPMQVNFDPRVLQVVSVAAGDFLSKDGQPVALVHREDQQSGTITLNATRPPGTGGISGSGSLYTFTFVARVPGQGTITVARPGGRSSTMAPIAMSQATANVSAR
jgi:general secretion pathway protein D